MKHLKLLLPPGDNIIMTDLYHVLSKRNRVEIKVRGSLFIATGKEVENRDEAEGFIEEISKEYYDATHNCFAFKVGYGGEHNIEYRYSDNGEPSGTAGAPIYKIIDGENLTNTVIVVTRYFGGTKLGTGGLIRAYGDAAKELIDQTGKSERILYAEIKVKYDYDITSQVMHMINTHKGEIIDSEYSDFVITKVKIRLSEEENLKEEILSFTNQRAEIL